MRVREFASVPLVGLCLVAAASWLGLAQSARAGTPVVLDASALDSVVAAGSRGGRQASALVGQPTKADRKSKKGKRKGKKAALGTVRAPTGPTSNVPVTVMADPIVTVDNPVVAPPPAAIVTPPSSDPARQGSSHVEASGSMSYSRSGKTKNHRQTLIVSGSASR